MPTRYKAMAMIAVLILAGACGTPRPTTAPPTIASTNTSLPPTATPVPATDTSLPPTATTAPPAATVVSPTPSPIVTPLPPTPTTNPRQNAPGRFHSIITDKYYKIYVELPRGYDLQATTVYPVVYLLDAQWYWDWLPGTDQFTGAVDLIRALSSQGHIPPVILVGIDTGSMLAQRHNTLVIDSPRFYAFLANELIPYIDTHYRTDPTMPRTLIGHSDGCYFVLYVLFQYGRVETPPFGYFLGLSGDHSQTGGQNFRDEQKLFNRIGQGSELDAALYLAWGDAEEERFTTSNPELVELLQSREYQDFRFKSIAFEGKDHDGTVYPGIKYGLVWIFGK